MSRRIACLLLLILSVAGFRASAQGIIPAERFVCLGIENALARDVNSAHSDIRPFLNDDFGGVQAIDSLNCPGCKLNGQGRRWGYRMLFTDHFLQANADTGRFFIAADPLLDLTMGYDLNDHGMIYTNGRGLQISGHAGKKLGFYTSYLETQARFSSWLDERINHYGVVPGMCRVKDFKGTSWDYGVATANISYSPWNFLNLQLGYGKNSFGNGYRSLLLSDNAFQYPFFKITARWKRFEYVSLHTGFQNIDSDSLLDAPHVWYTGYQNKPGSFHYLSVHINRWLQLGIFEGIVWKSRAQGSSAINFSRFIPVIFVNSLQYGLFARNNVLLGLNLNARPLKTLHVYGQFVLDDFHFKKPAGSGYQKTKWGFQTGLKYFDALGLDNLIIQLEYNQVRPYTYGHQDALQSYTHNNQALAHPLGANFREALFFADYRYKRIYASARFSFASQGADYGNSHWGADIFLSDTYASLGYNSVGNNTCQGFKQNLSIVSCVAGYMFSPAYRLCVEGGIGYRRVSGAMVDRQNLTVWLGIRTKLFNQYFDI